MLYQKKTIRNRILLGLLILACLVFLTLHYKEASDGALHRAQKFSLSVAEPFQAAANKITSPVKSSFGWVSDIFGSAAKYRKAKEQLGQLQRETVDRREAKMENVRLRELLELKEKIPYKSTTALVISSSGDNFRNRIIIDRGTRDGVQEEMPVICPDGVVGTVIASGPSAAEVKLITDNHSGVAALLQESRTQVIADGNGEGYIDLQYAKQATKVRVGELIVTSGMGGIFPKGMLIGVVRTAEPGIAAELFRRIEVTPAVDFSSLEEVLVLTGYPRQDLPLGGR